ncbi:MULTISPECIES: hypothetical protein [Prolixibacter]|jgi:hypothetical protein|uniref:Uncharacterized protein n=1 Tax=Prolixibacter denitrificans TaxID=1541063 RepID=A0A2P8CE15_9BACT|nr:MULTISPECIES: hypothetical protein [Prolixibacter]PSK83196.1 hypothetical protein CLV93_104126 [Prolixibacter denitrificans]GET21921.1 hypothetical protein JCM18694_21670 [Prolixibacter denitrificans]GET24614.1 hypothetical protein NT017_09430 [Prolixibacter sp. NT017]
MKGVLLILLFVLPLHMLLGQDFAANANGTKFKTKHPAEKEAVARAYKWEFYSPDLNSYQKRKSPVENGERFDAPLEPLKDMFNESYTDKEPIAPGNPATRIVIRKPSIYNAVRKIDKYYSKQVARGEMNSANARKSLERVLTIAIAALSERSQSFEDALQQNRRNPEALLAQFNQVKLKDM